MEDFTVVTGFDLDMFASNVKKFGSEGWKLHGSPFVSNMGGLTLYCQAMIKEPPQREKEPMTFKSKSKN